MCVCQKARLRQRILILYRKPSPEDRLNGVQTGQRRPCVTYKCIESSEIFFEAWKEWWVQYKLAQQEKIQQKCSLVTRDVTWGVVDDPNYITTFRLIWSHGISWPFSHIPVCQQCSKWLFLRNSPDTCEIHWNFMIENHIEWNWPTFQFKITSPSSLIWCCYWWLKDVYMESDFGEIFGFMIRIEIEWFHKQHPYS